MDDTRGGCVNRRGFFGAIGAAVGAIALPTGYVSWLQRKPKSYLYVVPTQKQAVKLYEELGRPRNVKVISAGSAICGYGAHLIVMDENWRGYGEQLASYMRQEWLTGWYNSSIRTRLYRDGRIITRKLV